MVMQSNLPSRICFRVVDQSNSQVVLDVNGMPKTVFLSRHCPALPPRHGPTARATRTFVSWRLVPRKRLL